jgi:hypothetical protein
MLTPMLKGASFISIEFVIVAGQSVPRTMSQLPNRLPPTSSHRAQLRRVSGTPLASTEQSSRKSLEVK